MNWIWWKLGIMNLSHIPVGFKGSVGLRDCCNLLWGWLEFVTHIFNYNIFWRACYKKKNWNISRFAICGSSSSILNFQVFHWIFQFSESYNQPYSIFWLGFMEYLRQVTQLLHHIWLLDHVQNFLLIIIKMSKFQNYWIGFDEN